MACGECESGVFGCGCCCASVTGLQGGIHPDAVKSLYVDLVLDTLVTPPTVDTHRTMLIHPAPIHIIGVEASLVATQRIATDTDAIQTRQLLETADAATANVAATAAATVSLFTLPGYDSDDVELGGFNPRDSQEQVRDIFCTLACTAYAPQAHAPPDIFGYFADAGLWVEFNAPEFHSGIRLVVRYVDRTSFSPAYADPITVLQHYWKCSHGDEEFLEGFYAGTSLELPSEGTNTVGTTTPNTTFITAWVSDATLTSVPE